MDEEEVGSLTSADDIEQLFLNAMQEVPEELKEQLKHLETISEEDTDQNTGDGKGNENVKLVNP